LLLAALLVTLAAVAAPGLARAATPCVSIKMSATAQKAKRKLMCWSREVLHPGTYAACAARAEVKFAKQFVSDRCAVPGDASEVEAEVDAFVDDVVGALTGSPAGSILGTSEAHKCASSKLKAAGEKVFAELRCYQRALGTAVPFECLGKATTNFMSAVTKAETAGGCAIVGDVTTLESAIDLFASEHNSPSFGCSTLGDPCGSTCGGGGECAPGCPPATALRCIIARGFIGCQSDLDCQGVLPGSVCAALTDPTCSLYFTGTCVMLCP
jgi:hypothetical protein